MIEDQARAEGSEKARRYFAEWRLPVEAALQSLASRRGRELAAIPGGGEESLGRLVRFALRGKMIRGCLVFLGSEASGGAGAARLGEGRLAACAAAMELFQAGLLAHDDIMDRDETRRGEPTMHARCAAELLAAGAREARHGGEALGICLGDLCYFEGFAELATALAGHPRAGEVLALSASILSEVAVAQMADVRWSSLKAEVGEADILAMYRGKTARYTFSLPLAVGALAADAPALVPSLVELGEQLGVLFQLRDDELGLFGSEARTGKGLGSDLREGKKTLFRARLLAAAPKEEAARLEALFSGCAEVGMEDLGYLRDLAGRLGVSASLGELARRCEDRALMLLRAMPRLPQETLGVFESLIEYVSRRDK